MDMISGPPWCGPPQAAHQLGRQDALILLASVQVGRVAFTLNALPTIRTVPHILDQDVIVIRADSREAIVSHAATSGAVVAYQADDLGPSERLGWSVYVTGMAQIVHSCDLAASYRERMPELDGMAAEGEDEFLSIQPTIITGHLFGTASGDGANLGRHDNPDVPA